jgi:hypothetical protein
MKIKKLENSIVKIKLKPNNEIPYIHGTYIGALVYDGISKGFVLSHPMTNDEITCGVANFDKNDVIEIWYASEEDKVKWKEKYYEFHEDVIRTKGFDSCEIDVKNLN